MASKKSEHLKQNSGENSENRNIEDSRNTGRDNEEYSETLGRPGRRNTTGRMEDEEYGSRYDNDYRRNPSQYMGDYGYNRNDEYSGRSRYQADMDRGYQGDYESSGPGYQNRGTYRERSGNMMGSRGDYDRTEDLPLRHYRENPYWDDNRRYENYGNRRGAGYQGYNDYGYQERGPERQNYSRRYDQDQYGRGSEPGWQERSGGNFRNSNYERGGYNPRYPQDEHYDTSRYNEHSGDYYGTERSGESYRSEEPKHTRYSYERENRAERNRERDMRERGWNTGNYGNREERWAEERERRNKRDNW